MSFNVSITEEAKDIALKYGKNVSQGILAMEGMIGKEKPVTTVTELTAVIKRMDRMEEGIRNVNGEFMNFISSGQGAVRIEKKGFVRASDIRTDNTNLNDIQ